MDDLLAEDKETEQSKEWAKLQKEVDTLKSQIAMGKADTPIDKFLRDTLAVQETALAKADKKKPTVAVMLSSLVTAKQNWELEVQRCRQRAESGADKAQARQEERRATIENLSEHLKSILEAVTYHDQCYEEAHCERTQQLVTRDKQISDLFDEKILDEKEKMDLGAKEATSMAADSNNDQLRAAIEELETYK